MVTRLALKAGLTSFKATEQASFWRLTAVLFLVFLASGLWSPLLSVYVASLGATTGDIGLVFGAYQATSLLSQFWWGRHSDRLGRRKPLLVVGTAALALSFLLIVAIDDWRWLVPARILEGIGLAAYSTGSLALVGDLLEDQRGRGRLMGLYRTFGSLAFAIAALGGGLLADALGTRAPLLLAAVCYALAFTLVTRIKEPPPAAAAVAAPGQTATLAPSPTRPARALLPFLTLTFTWTFGMGAVVSLWPVYMQGAGYSKTAVGGLWGLAALGEAPCFILAGYLADRWGPKRVLLTGILCMACVFLGYTVSTALAWLVAVQMVRSFAYACFEAPALLYTTQLGLRSQRGRHASLFYGASGVGGISGSVAGGAVAESIGLAAMYRGVVALMVVGVIAGGRFMPGLRSSVAPDRDGANTTR